jgi:DNA-binding PadR family transcriptional regulator
MKAYLGEFEELVLLTVVALGKEAYGVSIQLDIESRCKRSISIGALHSTITRLEEKGFLKSWMGGATQARGGRSKRFFEVTQAGKATLRKTKSLRDELWNISKLNLSAIE